MNKASTRPTRSEPVTATARPAAPQPDAARLLPSRPVSSRATATAIREMPLRVATQEALGNYFASLEGHRPGRLYDLVLREVEEPLFRAVMAYVEGNQTHAATILGINRGTLRKKLKEYGLVG
jgi:Fis family transcriptional regulator, factor for inversion stimulation protein